jgi:hypothetical protein
MLTVGVSCRAADVQLIGGGADSILLVLYTRGGHVPSRPGYAGWGAARHAKSG